MKKYLLLLLVATLWSCNSDDDGNQVNLEAKQTLNVSYGSDPEQKYDVYLPAGRNNNTKVIVLIHGGGWTGGSKEDMNAAVAIIKIQFPDYAIVNMDYRLATESSPAYPKQTDDIASVLSHVKSQDYTISDQFGLFGVSAGGHLSMLYAYKFDTAHEVKVVCNIVGPTDFNDPSYEGSELQTTLLPYLAGNNITEEFLAEVSPITHVSAQSPPTIQFMGNADPLIPTTQGTRLEAKLNTFGVSNGLHIYNAGHGNFSPTDSQDIYAKLHAFFTEHF